MIFEKVLLEKVYNSGTDANPNYRIVCLFKTDKGLFTIGITDKGLSDEDRAIRHAVKAVQGRVDLSVLSPEKILCESAKLGSPTSIALSVDNDFNLILSDIDVEPEIKNMLS